jgi:hypothetical protein
MTRRHHHEYRCACGHFAGQHLSGNQDRHSAPYPCTACPCQDVRDLQCVHCGATTT